MKALLKLCLALVLVGCVLAQSVREDDSLSSSRSSRKKEKDEELSPIGSWRAQVKGYAMVEENKIAELEGTLGRLIVPAMPADQAEMGKSKSKAKDEGKIAAVLYSAELSVSPQADSDMAPRTSNIAKKAGNKLRIFAVHRPVRLRVSCLPPLDRGHLPNWVIPSTVTTPQIWKIFRRFPLHSILVHSLNSP